MGATLYWVIPSSFAPDSESLPPALAGLPKKFS